MGFFFLENSNFREPPEPTQQDERTMQRQQFLLDKKDAIQELMAKGYSRSKAELYLAPKPLATFYTTAGGKKRKSKKIKYKIRRSTKRRRHTKRRKPTKRRRPTKRRTPTKRRRAGKSSRTR